MKKLSIVVSTCFLFHSSFAQNPSLVADVNTASIQMNVYGDIFGYNGEAWFDGKDNDGLYLWKTDGTANNTLKALKPALFQSSFSVHPFAGVVKDGLLYYQSASNSEAGDQNKLFVTDGTQAGTHKITDKVSNPYSIIVMDDVLYFAGTDPGSPYYDLWRSDGTDSGTWKVFDYTEDFDNTFFITGATVVGGELFFACGDWLFVTDGTTAGTTFLLNINGSISANPISRMVPYQDEVFFFTSDADSFGLFYSDGTVTGTQLVHGFNLTYYPNLSFLNGKLLMIADDGVHGAELWTSDGTPGGTIMIKDIYPGSNDGIDFYAGLSGLTIIDNEAYFFANDGIHGNEPWKSDGTSAGTVMIKDLIPGNEGTNPKLFRKLNDKVAFIANDSTGFGFFEGLYMTVGTDTGTHQVVSLPTAGVVQMATTGEKIFFDDQTYASIWVSDGTAAGTYAIPVNLDQNESSYPGQMVKLDNGKYLFVAYGNTGVELWTTDGTLPGSGYLMTSLDQYSQITLCPNTLNGTGFFSAITDSGSFYHALWKSDGTVPGTVKLAEIEPDFSRGSVVLNNILYFAAAIQGTGNIQFWRTNGTDTGTYMVANISINYLTLYNNEVYFNGGSPGDKELWKSDGTAAGTQLAVDIDPAGSSKPSRICVANGKLFFSATTDPEGEEPWISDGTANGTYLLRDIYLGNNKDSGPDHFTASGNYTYFSATDHDHGNELWRTDGTTAGTQLVKDIAPGDIDFAPNLLVDWNGTLFFTSSTNAEGRVWRTKGDEISTTVQLEQPSGNFTQLKNINDLVYAVLYYYGEDQVELWRMDTILCHNAQLNFFPEVNNENYFLLLADSNIVFMGLNAESTGQELWKYITQPISAFEICNNIDDDCNGIVDDNIIFPVPVITFDGYQLCADAFTTYHWYLNGAPLTGAYNQCYIPVNVGLYSVLVTDSTGCDGWSEDFPVGITGIDENFPEKLFFYPNPASTYILVRAGDQFLSEPMKLVITDIFGREIFSEEMTSSPFRIDIADWVSGMYLVCTVSANKVHYEGKLMRQ